MKKTMLGIMCLFLTLGAFAGCSKKEESQKIQRTVTVKELGLTYTTPEKWMDYQETNIYPVTIKSENTFAEIVYGYIKTEDMERLNSGEETSVMNCLNSICEIIVAKTENFKNGSLDSLLGEYNYSEELSEQGEYSYYIAYGHKEALATLTGDDLTRYDEILDGAPALASSVSTEAFDDTLLPAKEDLYAKTITFSTTALEGAQVDSTIFASYDLTILNFSQTNTYPKSDEFAVLQQVYETTSRMPEKINLITAIVDTPAAEAEATALKAKNDAGAEFLTIKLDTTLANWVTSNLKGVPSTVFVDSNGQIVGETLEGTKSAETYIEELNSRLEELKTR
ncbi:MAG: hypothetical protein VB018_15160 [Lachnospiraceae bacterium]|nr:hypothetical protein [Lachnospiraceae bacterium]